MKSPLCTGVRNFQSTKTGTIYGTSSWLKNRGERPERDQRKRETRGGDQREIREKLESKTRDRPKRDKIERYQRERDQRGRPEIDQRETRERAKRDQREIKERPENDQRETRERDFYH